MKRSSRFLTALLLFAGACVSPGPENRAGETLRALADARGFYIGAAVGPNQLAREPLYAETLAREFNCVTTENALKFSRVHPKSDGYDFRGADAIVDFAETHGMLVRGHTLVWHNMQPKWITEGDWTREQLSEVLKEHILTVVGRYRGRIEVWDVVNEAIGPDCSMRPGVWLDNIGADYVEQAFRWAHQADPSARLFYNDFACEGLGPKSDAVYAYVKGLLERGVPVHGVGLQMHIKLDGYPQPSELAANIQRLGALGLEVHITEMDVKIPEPVTDEKLAAQAERYRSLAEACLSQEACTALVLWGFTDRYSWIPRFFPGNQAALIFDERYRPKPAYFAFRTALGRP